MALTTTPGILAPKSGGEPLFLRNIAAQFDAAYQTGGESFDPADFLPVGCLAHVLPKAKNGYVPEFDSVTKKLKLFRPATDTRPSVTASVAGPYASAHGRTIIATINPDAAGPTAKTGTISAVAAALTSGNAETYNLDDGHTLLVKVDGGDVQTITFHTADFSDINAATAAEIAAVINGQIEGASAAGGTGSVVITSDKKGTGSHVQVTGGTSNSALGFSLTAADGTGNVADVLAITAAELAAIMNAVSGFSALAYASATADLKLTIRTVARGDDTTIQMSGTGRTDAALDNTLHTGVSAASAPMVEEDAGTDCSGITVDVLLIGV